MAEIERRGEQIAGATPRSEDGTGSASYIHTYIPEKP